MAFEKEFFCARVVSHAEKWPYLLKYGQNSLKNGRIRAKMAVL